MRSRTHLIAGTLATMEITILCGLPIVPLSLPVVMAFLVVSHIELVYNKFNTFER